MDKANDRQGITAGPRPDWWSEIKKDRPWIIVHVEDGPPGPRRLPSEALEDDDYFQPRWLDHGQTEEAE
jgi:hypothetical protein